MWCSISLGLSASAEFALFGAEGRSPQGFRKKLAALDTKYGIGLGHNFFGYGEDGKTKDKGDTTTAIACNRGGLKIQAIGQDACDTLAEKAPKIHSALINEAQVMIAMAVRSGEHEASFAPVEKAMVIKRLVVGHTREGNFWFGASKAVNEGATWMEVADRKIPKTISRGLMRQAVLLAREGHDVDGNVMPLLYQSLNDGRPWAETGQEFGMRAGIKLVSVSGHFIQGGKHRSVVVLKDVVFTTRCMLTGPWIVGRNKIEGCGELFVATQEVGE